MKRASHCVCFQLYFGQAGKGRWEDHAGDLQETWTYGWANKWSSEWMDMEKESQIYILGSAFRKKDLKHTE